MHALGRASAAMVAAALLFGTQIPGTAAIAAICSKVTKQVTADPTTGLLKVVIAKPSCPGNSSRAVTNTTRAGSAGARQPKLSDLCETTLMSPQPPMSDPAWTGHTSGAIYIKECPFTKAGQPTVSELWLGTPPPVVPTTTPSELARRALSTMRIPKPVIHRSPSDALTDAGLPVTWVNLWTWMWTTSASWRQLSTTASLGEVWATVTVEPTALAITPGDGSPQVSCTGPGRAWTKVDGNSPPTEGGCGYMYHAVSAGLTSRLSIKWAVSWTGSDGSEGQLPEMTTSASDRFAVQQVQVVN